MNHSFYLAKMPQGLRAQIEAESVYYPLLRQGETLETIWSNPDLMGTLYNRLSLREQKLLHIIVSSIGCEPFDSTRLERLASQSMSGADAKVGFLLLLKKGLVYPFRKTWGEHVYVMSLDSLSLWQRILFPGLEELPHLILTEEEAVQLELTHTRSEDLTQDVFQALVYMAQNEMKLTKNGTLHKRQLQKLVELLTIPDPWLEAVGLKYAYADVYPPKIAILIELLTRLQLLEPNTEELLLQEEGVRYWLTLSQSAQTSILYSIWKTVVFPSAAWLQHAVIYMERQREGNWFHGRSMMKWLRQQGLYQSKAGQVSTNEENSTEEAEALQQLESQWILSLIAFGWMEKGCDAQGSLTYRWRKSPLEFPATAGNEKYESAAESFIGEEEQRFYVQPDFEVLVPSGISFAVLWELSVVADLKKSDQLSVYRLSKESLQRAMENDRGLEEIIHFLERFAMYGLPDNVRVTLEQWAKPFGKVGFAHVVLLRCEDEAVAEAIRKLSVSKEYLLEPIGDLAWIVKADQLKAMTDMLTKAGWMPGKLAQLDGTGTRGNQGSSGRGTGAGLLRMELDSTSNRLLGVLWGERFPWSLGKGFIYSRHGVGYFDMEHQLPDIRDLYPDLNGIPAGWMKDYRAYHLSTRREIVEKAMEWRAELQVRYNGQDHYIAPRKLQESRGTWSVIGLEQTKQQEVCWFAEDWQEMKMILPGINDKY